MMCVQEAPPDRLRRRRGDWHLHVELLPPHRNPQRLKVRASVETALGVFINDTLPESLAGLLRAVPVVEHDWSACRCRRSSRVTARSSAARDGGGRPRPGRVTLIGDHTDYTGGLCLPMAIDRAITITGDAPAAGACGCESADEPGVADDPARRGRPAPVRAGVGPLRGRGGGRSCGRRRVSTAGDVDAPGRHRALVERRAGGRRRARPRCRRRPRPTGWRWPASARPPSTPPVACRPGCSTRSPRSAAWPGTGS